MAPPSATDRHDSGRGVVYAFSSNRLDVLLWESTGLCATCHGVGWDGTVDFTRTSARKTSPVWGQGCVWIVRWSCSPKACPEKVVLFVIFVGGSDLVSLSNSIDLGVMISVK